VGIGKGYTAPASTSGGLEGSLHDLLELLNDVFVEPVGQGQDVPALAIEVRPLLREPVFFQAKEYQSLAAPTL
jgi:hypothetical protein